MRKEDLVFKNCGMAQTYASQNGVYSLAITVYRMRQKTPNAISQILLISLDTFCQFVSLIRDSCQHSSIKASQHSRIYKLTSINNFKALQQ